MSKQPRAVCSCCCKVARCVFRGFLPAWEFRKSAGDSLYGFWDGDQNTNLDPHLVLEGVVVDDELAGLPAADVPSDPVVMSGGLAEKGD